MKSLRFQLLAGTTIGMTLVLLVAGGALYVLVGRMLGEEFDRALAAKGSALASLIDQDEDGLEFELADASLPEYATSDRPGYYEIWLPDGEVFARSPSLDDRDLEKISEMTAEPVFHSRTLPDGRPGRIVWLRFEPRREEHAGIAPPLTLTMAVGADVLDLTHTLARLRGLLIGVCVLAIVLSAGIQTWIIRRSTGRVARLSRQIGEVGEYDLSARIDPAGIPSELNPVVNRLNELLERIEAAFQRERRFTGDVAHELRTPLAGLRAGLELALSRERSAEAYRDTLKTSLNIDLQMQRLIENILQLARTDAGQCDIHPEPVDVADLIRQCWKPFEERVRQRRLAVEWRLTPSAKIETDREKLRLVVQNLLDNAVAHGDEGGRLTIGTSGDSQTCILEFGNTNNRLTAEETKHLFERFWRSDPSSRREDTGHCGLGLPLCKALLERLHGSIGATIREGGWFVVTVRLPVKLVVVR